MTTTKNIFGVKASLKIKYFGDLESLGLILKKGLDLNEVWYKSDQDPPHQITGMAQTLGFELWFSKYKENEFSLDISTTSNIDTVMSDSFHNVSDWLKEYLEITTNLDLELAE